jgi:hypothetical protein
VAEKGDHRISDPERMEEARERALLQARRRRKVRAIVICVVGFSVIGGLLAWGTIRATCPTIEEVQAQLAEEARDRERSRRGVGLEAAICKLLDIEERELQQMRGR